MGSGIKQTSRVVLLFATLLFAYFSVALLAALHRHSYEPCVVHFTALGTLTGLLGIASTFVRCPCAPKAYAVALLFLVVSAVHGLTVHLPRQHANCQAEATTAAHFLSVVTFDFQFFRIATVQDKVVDVVDMKQLHHCNKHVVHMYLFSVSLICVVGCSYIACSFKLASKLRAKLAKKATPIKDSTEEDSVTTMEEKEPLVEVITVHHEAREEKFGEFGEVQTLLKQ